MASAFLLYKYAGMGADPMLAVLAVWIVAEALVWVSRPPEPGEFRQSAPDRPPDQHHPPSSHLR